MKGSMHEQLGSIYEFFLGNTTRKAKNVIILLLPRQLHLNDNNISLFSPLWSSPSFVSHIFHCTCLVL